jgi:uncharacterized protein (TIGR03032 family)
MENFFDISYSEGLPDLFWKNRFSILITTYQAGKLIALGSTDGATLFQTPVSLKKPMGVAIQGSKLAVACMDEIRFFSSEENIHEVLNKSGSSYDMGYAQRATYHTGILDVHDLGFGDGVLWGVNTLLSCLSVYDINYSFRPKWKPPFIDVLVPEDRCHLNGMAMLNGVPRFVTALSKTNTAKGWRADKMNSGVLMTVPEGEIIMENLAMPHSPRFYQEKLYFLESGRGNLIAYDPESGKQETVFNFGCFIRGLAFKDNVAIIGKSKIRTTSKDFGDLAVIEGSEHAGFILFDMEKKAVIGFLNYVNSVEEIFDVQVLNDSVNPAIITHEIEPYNLIVTYPRNKFWRVEK